MTEEGETFGKIKTWSCYVYEVFVKQKVEKTLCNLLLTRHVDRHHSHLLLLSQPHTSIPHFLIVNKTSLSLSLPLDALDPRMEYRS